MNTQIETSLLKSKLSLDGLKETYGEEVAERMIDALFDCYFHELVEDVIYLTPQIELDEWANRIRDELEEEEAENAEYEEDLECDAEDYSGINE